MSYNGVLGQNNDQDGSRELYDLEGSHTELTPQCADSKWTTRNTFLDWCFVFAPRRGFRSAACNDGTSQRCSIPTPLHGVNHTK